MGKHDTPEPGGKHRSSDQSDRPAPLVGHPGRHRSKDQSDRPADDKSK